MWCFLQCGQDYRREDSGPEHASDFENAVGGHVWGFIPVTVFFNVFFLERTGPLFGPVLVEHSALVDG